MIVGPELRGRTDVLAEALSSPARLPGGGPRRLARQPPPARELAGKNASSLSPRTSCAASTAASSGSSRSRPSRRRSTSSAYPCESRGSTSRTWARRTRWHRWWSSAAPEEVRLPQVQHPAARTDGAQTTSRRCKDLGQKVLGRYVQQADISPHDSDRDASFASLPDLIVIDGGKGQLSAGLKSLEPLLGAGVAVVSLAKRIEEVFVPGLEADPAGAGLGRPADPAAGARRGPPVRDHLPPQPAGSRDDRVGARRCSRRRACRKRALLKHFGSPDRLLTASREELEAVPGVPGKLAREIHRQLHRAG